MTNAAANRPEPTPIPHPDRTLTVREDGVQLSFTFADCMSYHGPGFPGGVAHAFAALGRALPELAARIPGGRVEHREIHVRTPFGGPGARDAFELVPRAVTGGSATRCSRSSPDPSAVTPWPATCLNSVPAKHASPA